MEQNSNSCLNDDKVDNISVNSQKKSNSVQKRSSNQFCILVLLSGLLVRLVLVPLSMHVDPRFTGDIAVFSTIVQWWSSAEEQSQPFLYPPLANHTLSIFILRLAQPFAPDLPDQLVFGKDAQLAWIASPHVFRNLFMLKMWYLLADFATAVFLWRMLRDRPTRVRRLALIAWLFNPLVLFTAYFHGQFDLVPTFFVVLSLHSARKGQADWAGFWMGISACYKNYAFFFLLPLVLILGRTWLVRSKILVMGTLPYLLFFIPYISRYTGHRTDFVSSFFPAGYDVGRGAQVYFFFALYAVLLWYLYYRKVHTFEDLWRTCFAILLAYYQFSYYNLHYWVWVVPFAILFLVERPSEAKPFHFFIGLCLLVLTASAPLARYLAPISPRFFLRLPRLLDVLNPYLPMFFLLNVVRSLLAGTCFCLAWRLLRYMPALRGEEPREAAGSAAAP